MDSEEYQRHVEARAAALAEISQFSAEALVKALETQVFPYPMDMFHGSNAALRHLYLQHGPALTEAQLDRLELAAKPESCGMDSVQCIKLQCHLSALRKDEPRLRRIWDEHVSRRPVFAPWSAFALAAGDLRTTDDVLIASLVEVVRECALFGPRREAMVSLGKIGPPAGDLAADVIEENIYDSSSVVVALRDRVLTRIRAADVGWRKCPDCVAGFRFGDSYWLVDCDTCFSLNLVPE